MAPSSRRTCGSPPTWSDCPGSGLVIGAPGVTIDLAGHVIDGTGSGAGIDNEAGHDDVRIRRGTVREFVFGVILFQADGARLERLDAIANLDGFKIASSVDVELDRVTAVGNVGPGVEITFSDQVTVRRSTFTDNGLWGVVDRFSERSRHVGNTIVGNDASGLTLDRTGGAVVERNRIAANAGHGIELVASVTPRWCATTPTPTAVTASPSTRPGTSCAATAPPATPAAGSWPPRAPSTAAATGGAATAASSARG